MSDTIQIGSVYLAEADDSVSAFALDGQQASQISQGLRAVAATPINRKNRQVTITFVRTRRPHASVEAARAFMIDHDIELRGISASDCTFAFTANGGTTTRTLSDAVVTSHRAEQIGLTTRHTYIVVGGTLT